MSKNLTKQFDEKKTTTKDSENIPPSIQKLLDKRAEIDEKLKQHKAKQKKKDDLLRERLKEKERKADTHRKILIGGTYSAAMEKEPKLYDDTISLLDKYLVNAKDRKVFPELNPLHRNERAEAKKATG